MSSNPTCPGGTVDGSRRTAIPQPAPATSNPTPTIWNHRMRDMRRGEINGCRPSQQKPDNGAWRGRVGVHTFFDLFPGTQTAWFQPIQPAVACGRDARRAPSASESFGYITAKSDWVLAHLYEFFEVFACSSIGFAIVTHLPRVNVPQRATNR